MTPPLHHVPPVTVNKPAHIEWLLIFDTTSSLELPEFSEAAGICTWSRLQSKGVQVRPSSRRSGLRPPQQVSGTGFTPRTSPDLIRSLFDVARAKPESMRGSPFDTASGARSIRRARLPREAESCPARCSLRSSAPLRTEGGGGLAANR